MSINSDPLVFNDEIGIHILSFLEPKDLGRCAQVSTTWKRLSDDNDLWKQMWPTMSDMPMPVDIASLKEKIKEYTKYGAHSFEDALAKIDKFVKTVPLNEVRQFNVLFPMMNRSQISIHVGRGDAEPDMQPTGPSEHCLLVKDLKMKPGYLIQFQKEISTKIFKILNGQGESNFFVSTQCDQPGMTVGPYVVGKHNSQPKSENKGRKIIMIASGIALAVIGGYIVMKKWKKE